MQPLDTTSCDLLLPPEGISAAANLFALIAESELKGASYLIHRNYILSFYELIHHMHLPFLMIIYL